MGRGRPFEHALAHEVGGDARHPAGADHDLVGEVAPRSRTVVVVGGGYGGTVVARALDDVAQVVLVEPRDAFVHSIGALRAVVDPAWAPRIFLPYDHLLANGRVVRDRAERATADEVLLGSGERLRPDFVVLATGSSYPFPAKSDLVDTEEALAKYRATHSQLASARSVLLLGAGPVGIELAGEITSAWPDKHVILADVAHDILAGPYKPELRAELRRQLSERDVELVLGADDPSEISADLVFHTHGVTPETGYLAGELAAARTPDGRVAVTPELRVAGHDTVFALGDIAAGHVQKAATAQRQAPVVADNIRALISGDGKLATYEPRPPAIVVPLGPSGGAGQLPGSEQITGPDAAAEIKGRDLMLERFEQALGLAPTPASPS